ncbi:MAG: serine/threonine protein kinase [Planctomyces sp.]|nr:serine/threonine protein kinase [Planctomyces sp.]
MAGRMIGPFELGERLGVGGMGIVYRATYVKTGAPVAIKILSPDLSQAESLQKRFEREVAILKKLQHPHIVRYYGGGKLGTQRFYAMELVHGGSMETYLQEKGKLPWAEVLEIALQVAKALEHSHAAGVIHRDLKPANLLRAKDGTLKLTDFGIARDTTATALTAAGRTVGTYSYMAPEQIRGKPPVDRRTDLYALGCVMFEMITGETPFRGDNAGEMLILHLQEEPPLPTSLNPECPKPIEDLILKLLEKEPDERPFDALSVQVSIEQIQEQLTRPVVQPVATQEVEQPKKKKKKKKTAAVPIYERAWFLGTVLAVLLFLATIPFWPASEDQLFAKAEALMKSEETTDWGDAYKLYLLPLKEKFPEGKHAATVQEYIDKVEMHQAERRARTNANKGRDAGSEAERLYIEADRYEKFGDRVTALEKYESMVNLLKDRPQDRPYVMLARQRIAIITAAGGDPVDRVQMIEQSLAKADDLAIRGKVIEARTLWNSILTLYAGNQELEAQVRQARQRLSEKSVSASEEKSGEKVD